MKFFKIILTWNHGFRYTKNSGANQRAIMHAAVNDSDVEWKERTERCMRTTD